MSQGLSRKYISMMLKQKLSVSFLEPNSLRNYSYNELRLTAFTTLTYETTLAQEHDVKVLAGYNQETFDSRRYDAYKESFPNNDLTELDVGALNPNA